MGELSTTKLGPPRDLEGRAHLEEAVVDLKRLVFCCTTSDTGIEEGGLVGLSFVRSCSVAFSALRRMSGVRGYGTERRRTLRRNRRPIATVAIRAISSASFIVAIARVGVVQVGLEPCGRWSVRRADGVRKGRWELTGGGRSRPGD